MAMRLSDDDHALGLHGSSVAVDAHGDAMKRLFHFFTRPREAIWINRSWPRGACLGASPHYLYILWFRSIVNEFGGG